MWYRKWDGRKKRRTGEKTSNREESNSEMEINDTNQYQERAETSEQGKNMSDCMLKDELECGNLSRTAGGETGASHYDLAN